MFCIYVSHKKKNPLLDRKCFRSPLMPSYPKTMAISNV